MGVVHLGKKMFLEGEEDRLYIVTVLKTDQMLIYEGAVEGNSLSQNIKGDE